MEKLLLLPLIQAALAEDVGQGDVTTDALGIGDKPVTATLVAREALVVAGLDVAHLTFQQTCKELQWQAQAADGQQVAAGAVLATITADAAGVLKGERVALNYLQFLCGIATETRKYVEAVAHTKAKILDTRKTVPGLRVLSKYAAKMGGAVNHRMRLDDAILIKDNHIALAGGDVDMAVSRAMEASKKIFSSRGLQVIVECDTLKQVEVALRHRPSRLLLDNMSLSALRDAVRITAGRIPLEASGGVSLATVAAIAETGVDFISVGKITHSAGAVDIALDVM